jgi:hypothetical protein
MRLAGIQYGGQQLQWFGRPFVGDGAHRLERLHPQMKQ